MSPSTTLIRQTFPSSSADKEDEEMMPNQLALLRHSRICAWHPRRDSPAAWQPGEAVEERLFLVSAARLGGVHSHVSKAHTDGVGFGVILHHSPSPPLTTGDMGTF